MSGWLPRFVLPLAFGLAFAFVVTGAWQRVAQINPVPSITGPVVPASPPAESWTGVILDANILGLEVPEPDSSLRVPLDQLASFDFRLLGTVTGSRAQALVRRDDDFSILRLGEALDGWELAEVRIRSAVFVSGGRREVAVLWVDPPDATSPEPGFGSGTGQPWPPPSAGNRVSLSRQEVQPLLSDPNTLLQMANFKPFTVDGRVSGFQVLSIRPDSLLYRVGLRNGDVLARINGQTLTGPTQLLQAYAGMDRSSLITLDVQRASQMQTFLVEVN